MKLLTLLTLSLTFISQSYGSGLNATTGTIYTPPKTCDKKESYVDKKLSLDEEHRKTVIAIREFEKTHNAFINFTSSGRTLKTQFSVLKACLNAIREDFDEEIDLSNFYIYFKIENMAELNANNISRRESHDTGPANERRDYILIFGTNISLTNCYNHFGSSL